MPSLPCWLPTSPPSQTALLDPLSLSPWRSFLLVRTCPEYNHFGPEYRSGPMTSVISALLSHLRQGLFWTVKAFTSTFSEFQNLSTTNTLTGSFSIGVCTEEVSAASTAASCFCGTSSRHFQTLPKFPYKNPWSKWLTPLTCGQFFH